MPDALVPLRSLDTLWIQITGTLCNIRCDHCFISCSPTNDSLGMMSRSEIKGHTDEALSLGTREFYMTGGEPFLHQDIIEIIDDILSAGPLTVLTNATLITSELARELQVVELRHEHELTFRVSLDGPDAPRNDAIRGKGVFERTVRGVASLVRRGFRPIMTMMRSWEEAEDDAVLTLFRKNLSDAGYPDASVKLLPVLHLGAEVNRGRAYLSTEKVTSACISDYDLTNLLCHTSRMVSADGVHACPILVGEPGSLMGRSLEPALGSVALDHQACFTCVVNGAICTNETSC